MKRKIIDQIIKAFSLEPAEDITLLDVASDVNTIYIVTIAGKKYTVRLNSNDNDPNEVYKEKWAIEKAGQVGVLVPNVHSVGTTLGVPYTIFDYIEGKDGRHASDKKRLWNTLGAYAKKLHTISDEDNRGKATWGKYISYNISSLNDSDPLLALGVLTKETSAIAKGFFEELQATHWKFGLTHNDLSLKNVIVDAAQNVFLIDWGSAEMNIVPYFEFVELMECHLDLNDPNDECFAEFLTGYGLSDEEFRGMGKTLSTLILLVAFDKLRWAIDKRPDRIADNVVRAKKRLEVALKAHNL